MKLIKESVPKLCQKQIFPINIKLEVVGIISKLYETVLFYDYARKMVYDVIMEVNYFDCENKKDTRISAMKQVVKIQNIVFD